jgi:hypothetical protein
MLRYIIRYLWPMFAVSTIGTPVSPFLRLLAAYVLADVSHVGCGVVTYPNVVTVLLSAVVF